MGRFIHYYSFLKSNLFKEILSFCKLLYLFCFSNGRYSIFLMVNARNTLSFLFIILCLYSFDVHSSEELKISNWGLKKKEKQRKGNAHEFLRWRMLRNLSLKNIRIQLLHKHCKGNVKYVSLISHLLHKKIQMF